MGKAERDALAECERDDIGQCRTCTSLANDGEIYCPACKDYWENDAGMMSPPDLEWLQEGIDNGA